MYSTTMILLYFPLLLILLILRNEMKILFFGKRKLNEGKKKKKILFARDIRNVRRCGRLRQRQKQGWIPSQHPQEFRENQEGKCEIEWRKKMTRTKWSKSFTKANDLIELQKCKSFPFFSPLFMKFSSLQWHNAESTSKDECNHVIYGTQKFHQKLNWGQEQGWGRWQQDLPWKNKQNLHCINSSGSCVTPLASWLDD